MIIQLKNNMIQYFQKDVPRLKHALKVFEFAQIICESLHLEKEQKEIIYYSAILHDIGIKEAEQKYNNNDPAYQEKLGPNIARDILQKLQADPKLIEEVCDIIGHHHHPRDQESANFKVVFDADLLVNLEEIHHKSPFKKEEIKTFIEKNFLTNTGKTLAKDIFFRRNPIMIKE